MKDLSIKIFMVLFLSIFIQIFFPLSFAKSSDFPSDLPWSSPWEMESDMNVKKLLTEGYQILNTNFAVVGMGGAIIEIIYLKKGDNLYRCLSATIQQHNNIETTSHGCQLCVPPSPSYPLLNSEANRTLKNSYTAAMAYFTDYPAGVVTVEKLEQSGLTKPKDIQVTIENGTQENLLIKTFHSNGNKIYSVNASGQISSAPLR